MEGDGSMVEYFHKEVYYFKARRLCSFKTSCWKFEEKPFHFTCLAPLKIGWFIPSSSVRKPSLQQRSSHPPPRAQAHTHTHTQRHASAGVHVNARLHHPPNDASARRHTSKQMHTLAHTRAQTAHECTVTPRAHVYAHAGTRTHNQREWWALLISQVDFFKFKE